VCVGGNGPATTRSSLRRRLRPTNGRSCPRAWGSTVSPRQIERSAAPDVAARAPQQRLGQPRLARRSRATPTTAARSNERRCEPPPAPLHLPGPTRVCRQASMSRGDQLLPGRSSVLRSLPLLGLLVAAFLRLLVGPKARHPRPAGHGLGLAPRLSYTALLVAALLTRGPAPRQAHSGASTAPPEPMACTALTGHQSDIVALGGMAIPGLQLGAKACQLFAQLGNLAIPGAHGGGR